MAGVDRVLGDVKDKPRLYRMVMRETVFYLVEIER